MVDNPDDLNYAINSKNDCKVGITNETSLSLRQTIKQKYKQTKHLIICICLVSLVDMLETMPKLFKIIMLLCFKVHF